MTGNGISQQTIAPDYSHPRTLGWRGTVAMAMGGINQSLFILTALFVGQDAIIGQGSAAVPLLWVGLLLSWAAVPGWLELVLLFPQRVGGIAATCAEAFKPYSPVLSNLTGVCYWWGWIPTCGVTAIFSGSAIHEWILPGVPYKVIATAIVVTFTAVNLAGVKWAARVAIPVATLSALLAFTSALAPIWSGHVDWHRAFDFHLTTPFSGWFGALTSSMAGLYLIGFAAPAFEAAMCHVGETINPEKNVPRAVWVSAGLAALYFVVLPVVWLGTLGAGALGQQLMLVLGPTFAPVLGGAAKGAAIWFMMFNMFHGTLQPLAGAARTLSQLSEDGLLPECLSWRIKTDAPLVATLVTAGFALFFLFLDDPLWLIASANFTYLIGICLPSVAVFLLRKNEPTLRRPYRAPRGTIFLGLVAASVWGVSAILGFQQFGLATVIIGLIFAYSGSVLYAWRKFSDRRKRGLPGLARTLHIKLTGAMLIVLILDGAGYLIAVQTVGTHEPAQLAVLEDIFVAVAMLTITVGLVLPGMIAHSAVEVSRATERLVTGTVADFTRAMQALGRGDLDAAHARVDIEHVQPRGHDEVTDMAESFNILQTEIARGADGLGAAREGLRTARDELKRINRDLEARVHELAASLQERHRVEGELREAKEAAEAADQAKSQFLAMMSHEIRTPMNGVIGYAHLLRDTTMSQAQREYVETICHGSESLLVILNDILDLSRVEAGMLALENHPLDLARCLDEVISLYRPVMPERVTLHCSIAADVPPWIVGDVSRLRQILLNLVGNAVKFTERGAVTMEVARSERATALESDGLCFRIADSGIGIPADKMARLFTPFSQVDASRTRKHGGTGLGLSICKKLADLMRGRIEVTSTIGVGSTFTFTLPLIPSAAGPAEVLGEIGEDLSASASDRSLRILLAEDLRANQVLTMHMLTKLGYAPVMVANGAQCVARFFEEPFDLILMDVQMPEMDGLEATEEIRRRERVAARPPVYICALTANVMAHDRAACLTAGMNDVLAKPLRPPELAAALERCLSTRA